MSPVARVQSWLDERFGWAELIAPLKHKTVPHHKLSYWYFLGGITLFLFVIQVTTGILLLLYYRPSANEAFDLAQARYKAGSSSIVELSQAQLNQTEAEIAQAKAKYEYQIRNAVMSFQLGQLQ